MSLEKADDTVPREMVIVTLRWMRVPEEVRLFGRDVQGNKGNSLSWSSDVRDQSGHRVEAGKLSQPSQGYHGDGAGTQEGKNEEDVRHGRSSCCGGE